LLRRKEKPGVLSDTTDYHGIVRKIAQNSAIGKTSVHSDDKAPALIILFITLCITPIRRISGWNGIIRFRRLIGLFSFFYAVIHLLIYLAFDRGFVFAELGEDIAKRPYITIGMLAVIGLAISAAS
jgi:DMSO/TMAO reductase YedYZ heme-binding membrane subunit